MIRDDKSVPSTRMNERQYVELPLLRQLQGLGWTVLDLEMHNQDPDETGRTDASEIVLLPRLRSAIERLNPWIEADQVQVVVDRLMSHPPGTLEANRYVLDLLLGGTPVDQNRETGETSPDVRLLDLETGTNNDLLAVCQFKVRVPGTAKHIYPDVTLFVNGVPMVIIEAKAPGVADGTGEAFKQLQRYLQRPDHDAEGHAGLAAYNQALVVTNGNEARFGTVTARSLKYFYPWSDPYPTTLDELSQAVGSGQGGPTAQDRLVAGMFTPQHWVELLRSFVVFNTLEDGTVVKALARYQQFRAVRKAVARLASGATPRQRGGIVWHTQGSGKSLTMVYLVREMHRHARLSGWKVVFVTDRTDLEEQLGGTMFAVGKTVKEAGSIAALKTLLPGTAADLVMAMIHKFNTKELEVLFPKLSDRSDILVLTDEAHRSQYGLLAANLDRAIPNATRIGFTGTPIEATKQTFGTYIDTYTMRESNADGVTLQIVYEGRTSRAEIVDADAADKAFIDVFSDYSVDQQLQALGYGTRKAYLEAASVIEAKAADMVRHYTEQVFPNGFKAQVVATSQEAAYRYGEALRTALAARADALDAAGSPPSVDTNLLRRVRVGIVVSGVGNNDAPHIKALANTAQRAADVANFKRAFDSDTDEAKDGNVGVLVVNNMLLTGFDAPIEQVLYLDRVIRDHTLLQAIARVNRAGPKGKGVGFVVDYVGVGSDLKKALEVYAEEEQAEIVDQIADPAQADAAMKTAAEALRTTIREIGVDDPDDLYAYFAAFYDDEARARFLLAFGTFTSAFNTVLPRKEALDYLDDFLRATEVAVQARAHLDDASFSLKDVPPKLRRLADAHLREKGIEQSVAPISILDDAFEAEVAGPGTPKAKAAKKKRRTATYIEDHFGEDPALFASFAAELARILQSFGDNWTAINEALDALRKRMRDAAKEPTYGLSRRREMPTFRVLRERLFSAGVTEDDIGELVPLTQELTELMATEMAAPGFWRNVIAQKKLLAEVTRLLMGPRYSRLGAMPARYKELGTTLMEFARHNRDTLLYAE